MSDVAIRIENLAKEYHIGKLQNHKTFRDALANSALKPLRAFRSLVNRNGHHSADKIWALEDISLEVKQGDVVGIIGRNGAGKSTLLKILSRITEPTKGYADVRGRVGSLLEVGTGFSPELTGRENIYLNGAILGMKRAEIKRKFDEIVAFSEVDKFIDTPVKHYSSGMYLRLAFSVAAHLDPDILLMDEVLAVGDASFQKRCLGKMGDVAKQGRTVLLVSHNMAAIKSFCSKSVLMKDGRIAFEGGVAETLSRYLLREKADREDLSHVAERGGNGPVRIRSLRVLDHLGHPIDSVLSGQEVTIELRYHDNNLYKLAVDIYFHISVSTPTGERLFDCSNRFAFSTHDRLPPSGCIKCVIPKLPLNQGQYVLDVACKADKHLMDQIWGAATLNVISGDFFETGRIPEGVDGPIVAQHSWHLDESTDIRHHQSAGISERAMLT